MYPINHNALIISLLSVQSQEELELPAEPQVPTSPISPGTVSSMTTLIKSPTSPQPSHKVTQLSSSNGISALKDKISKSGAVPTVSVHNEPAVKQPRASTVNDKTWEGFERYVLETGLVCFDYCIISIQC